MITYLESKLAVLSQDINRLEKYQPLANNVHKVFVEEHKTNPLRAELLALTSENHALVDNINRKAMLGPLKNDGWTKRGCPLMPNTGQFNVQPLEPGIVGHF